MSDSGLAALRALCDVGMLDNLSTTTLAMLNRVHPAVSVPYGIPRRRVTFKEVAKECGPHSDVPPIVAAQLASSAVANMTAGEKCPELLEMVDDAIIGGFTKVLDVLAPYHPHSVDFSLVWMYAVCHRRQESVAWLLKADLDYMESAASYYCAQTANVDNLVRLRSRARRGFNWKTVLLGALTSHSHGGGVRVILWLIDEGYDVTWASAMQSAIRYGNTVVVDDLMHLGVPVTVEESTLSQDTCHCDKYRIANFLVQFGYPVPPEYLPEEEDHSSPSY